MAIESDDGRVFDLDALAATAIREEMDYYDLWAIPRALDIAADDLAAAIGSDVRASPNGDPDGKAAGASGRDGR